MENSTLKNLAENVLKNTSDKYFLSLDNIRKKVTLFTEKHIQNIQLFTDHSIRHSEEVLFNANILTKALKIDLNNQESYILISACYLHDIGLIGRCAFDKIKHPVFLETSPKNLRKSHPYVSELIVRDKMIQKELDLILDFPTEFLSQQIADLCRMHNSLESIMQIPSSIVYSNYSIRKRLLLALLIAGDELHVGRGRVNTQYLPTENVPLNEKMFWFRLSSIEGFKIKGITITLKFLRPLKIDSKSFLKYVVNTTLEYYKRSFEKLNEVFIYEGFKAIKFENKITDEEIATTDEMILFMATSIIENDIRQRQELREKKIRQKIQKVGPIKSKKINKEFIALRRWSSYTPRMPKWNSSIPSSEASRGGGYLLIWQNHGIIIDPGYDFLRNLWEEPRKSKTKFELSDINTIICSHAHDDHTHDIEPIFSLLYKKNKISKRKQAINLYCSEGVHLKYQQMFSSNNSCTKQILVPSRNNIPIEFQDSHLSNLGISLEILKNYHNEHPWLLNNTGFALKFNLAENKNDLLNKNFKLKIGYTSDTRFFVELAEFLSDCDLVVIHFGNVGPKIGDIDPYDNNHLGINGCHNLIAALKNEKPRLFLIDEFGEEEIGEDRIPLCDMFDGLIGLHQVGKTVLPIDIGLRVKLPELQIFCEEHDHFVNQTIIKPHKTNTSDGIVYYCS